MAGPDELEPDELLELLEAEPEEPDVPGLEPVPDEPDVPGLEPVPEEPDVPALEPVPEELEVPVLPELVEPELLLAFEVDAEAELEPTLELLECDPEEPEVPALPELELPSVPELPCAACAARGSVRHDKSRTLARVVSRCMMSG